jgi:hypothetical protein
MPQTKSSIAYRTVASSQIAGYASDALRKPTKLKGTFGRRTDRKDPAALHYENYAGSTGYVPLYWAMLADLPRLSRSVAFDALVLFILAHSHGRDETRPADTPPIADQYLADATRCDLRELRRNVDYGVRAGIFTRRPVGKGFSIYNLQLTKWESLPDYKDWLKANLHEANPPDPDDPEPDPGGKAEPIQPDAEDPEPDVELMKEPAPVRPGKASQAVKIEVAVRAIQLDCSQLPVLPVDLFWKSRVKAGQLIVSLSVPTVHIGEEKANPFGHPCPKASGEPSICSPVVRLSASPKPSLVATKEHPRAKELCEIFDPLLAKWGTEVLSHNPEALKRACQALDNRESKVGELPHDTLVKFSKERAKRRISSPLHCAQIIQGAAKAYAVQQAAGPEEEDIWHRMARDRHAQEERVRRLREARSRR